MSNTTHHITATEYALLGTLACIVLETMDYSPAQRLSADSYLPPQLIEQAQQALAAYGKRIQPDKSMMAYAELVNNLAPCQPLQALGVSSPVMGGVGGDASIVVEVYALGRGVALVTDGSDLLGREGTFELEANGKVFVFDPLGAAKTNGFVAPVQGHIAAIGQAVKAVDQEQLAELGCGAGQDGSPGKTAILGLPPGMGKTTIAPALAKRLGCTSVVDEWTPSLYVTPGALHVTNAAALTGIAA